MPYTKKKQPKRSYKKRTSNVQNQIKSIKKRIKKEPKVSVQSAVTGTLISVSTPATAVHVDVGAGGSTNGVTLEGSRAMLKSLRIKGFFQAVGATSTGGRLDIILDRRPVAGTIATFNEVYYPDTGSLGLNQMMLPINKGRFKLLASFRATSVTNENQRYYFDRYLKLNHVIETKSEANYNQTYQNKNAIIIFKWSDTAANNMTYEYVTQTVVLDDN